jgi:hypothetical protein
LTQVLGKLGFLSFIVFMALCKLPIYVKTLTDAGFHLARYQSQRKFSLCGNSCLSPEHVALPTRQVGCEVFPCECLLVLQEDIPCLNLSVVWFKKTCCITPSLPFSLLIIGTRINCYLLIEGIIYWELMDIYSYFHIAQNAEKR